MAVKIDLNSGKRIATRESYGKTLVELGREHDDIIVLDADLAETTKTAIFKKEFPERHFDCGIAEANMMGVAAGLAACGKTVFASSFAMFAAGRAFEQVRNAIAHPNLNVKVAATHAGITDGEDGATHQCIEDISVMRSIPNMMVVVPSDAVETRYAIKAAYEHKGPMYIRLGRPNIPVFNVEEGYEFELGKAIVLKEGSDVSIFATGIEVYEALKASEMLKKHGIDAEIINIHTIKPIDKELIIKSVKKTKKAVTVEEHSIIGGLYSAICEVTSGSCPVPVCAIGINDRFGYSGEAWQLVREFGLDAESICMRVMNFVKQ